VPKYTHCDKGHELICEGHDNWICPVCDETEWTCKQCGTIHPVKPLTHWSRDGELCPDCDDYNKVVIR